MTLPAPSINVANARLPKSYESARNALANCASIDECQEWADRAEALASYAKMSEDNSLRKLADRIQARAIRRAGELLKQIEPGQGARDGKRGEGTHTPLTREEAAQSAGMSKHQQIQAIRVANVPAAEFERQVESEAPPTVTKLAVQGTQKRTPTLAVKPRPEGFAAATDLIGTVEDFSEFCRTHDPEIIAAAVMPHELKDVREQVAIIDGWLDRFVVNLKD